MAANIPAGPPVSPWQPAPPPPPGPNVQARFPAADGSGTFASGAPIPVPPGRMLITYALAGFTATLQGKYPNGQLTPALTFLATGGTFRFSGAVFSEVVPSAGDANIAWFTIPDGPYPPFDEGQSLASVAGVPFVSVGNGAGFTYSTLEAALAFSLAQGGAIIDVDPGFTETTANQIVMPSNTWLRSWMGGGEVSGPTIIAPRAQITSTYTGGPAVLFSDVTRARITGMAFATAQAVPLVDIQNRSRHCIVEDSFLQNTGSGGSASGGAFKGEGGSSSAQNAEHHMIDRNVLLGDPAIVIGTAGETSHFNDSRFDHCLVEGPTGTSVGTTTNSIVYIVTQGGNLRFKNLYSRGAFGAGQMLFNALNANGGSYFLEEGEIQVGGGTAYNVGGGTLTVQDLSITNTNGPTFGAISGGQIEFRNATIQAGTLIHQQSAGITLVGDKQTQIPVGGAFNWANNPNVTTTLNGSLTAIATAVTTVGDAGFPAAPFVAYIDQEAVNVTSVGAGTNWTVVRAFLGTTGATHANAALVSLGGTTGGTTVGGGLGNWPVNPGTGGVRLPAHRNADLLTNPPVSGTWYGPFSASSLGYDAHLDFGLDFVAAADTVKVDISPDGGNTIQNQLPATAGGVIAAHWQLQIEVPAGYYYRVTLAGSPPTLAAGTLLARAPT